jgi:hypothetical protein
MSSTTTSAAPVAASRVPASNGCSQRSATAVSALCSRSRRRVLPVMAATGIRPSSSWIGRHVHRRRGRNLRSSPSQVAAAARRLREAELNLQPCSPIRTLFPELTDEVSAYRVQAEDTSHSLAASRRLVGRKIGLTAKWSFSNSLGWAARITGCCSRSDVRSLSRSKYAQFQVARGDADRERTKQRHGIKRARLWRTNRMICYRAAAR